MDASAQLLADLNSDDFAHGVAQEFWKFDKRVGTTVYVTMFAMDGDRFLLETQCDRYGDEPILGRFVDPQSYTCVSSAWPIGNEVFGGWFKWQPNDLFICWPGDRGGIQRHADWRAQARWRQGKNQLVDYLEFVRQCLNLRSRGYLPRAQQAA
jgi:hypothetical protein